MINNLFHLHTRNWFTNALGEPTPVQHAAWPAIANGEHTLVSAPTGTGKTLSAFLVFIDRLKAEARAGSLTNELKLIYISPLKALAGDIRENLHRPLNGIHGEESRAGDNPSINISLSIRTGDTSAYERRRMIKTPPHILITTPESLYLLLTSISGQGMLKTAQAIIIDELHAMIDTKRGAHLMLSLARLDKLCEKPLQRIGLSATINPLEDAAAYLAGGDMPVTIAAPHMHKDIRIEVASPIDDMTNLPNGNIWPEIARSVYEECYGMGSVIAFVDGRMHAEKLAHQVNLIAEGDFARTHHGCVSKEQRLKAENDLRSGDLRLLVATSSMELGIDVGDIDRVVQIAYPRSISSLMQRLGRAGHNPGRESVMRLYPRTAQEGLYCGLTADTASKGGIEKLHPPRLCLDVLAQHLVSMATGDGYTINEAFEIVQSAYPFRHITQNDLKSVLCMLAGDYEHMRDLPVRPRILYDRINERVDGDAYSRMLALSTGGTIPDMGLFTVKTENGVKIGELDEEFVFEQRVGMKFMLGSFAWKITAMNKDTVMVTPSNTEGANPPFWRMAWLSRKLQTGLAFGKRMRELTEAGNRNEYERTDAVVSVLRDMGLDESMANNTTPVILRQLKATGILPDDGTVIAEHFTDEAGDHQLMLHSIFGRQVNAPLAILLQEAAQRIMGCDVSAYEDDDGILLMAHGQEVPENLIQSLEPSALRGELEALLPATPLFNMTFRYNAGRALMMGVRKGKRQPLWIQRLRSSEMLDSIIHIPDHPLIRETKRECLEDYWDLPGLEQVLSGIQNGAVQVRELHRKDPSPLSLTLRRAAEASLMYSYFPSTNRINQSARDALDDLQKIKPAAEQLARVSERKKLPENNQQLHSLLMMEGDLIAGELNLPIEWFESLAAANRVRYIEPGLWIAAEHLELYEQQTFESYRIITRRALRYRGAFDPTQLAERYALPLEMAAQLLQSLAESNEAVEENGWFYHGDLYEYARRETISDRRRQVKTRRPQVYAALMASRLYKSAPPAEQLKNALQALNGRAFPVAAWESIILPARVNQYRPALLDALLASGEWFWVLDKEYLSFHPSEDVDWDYDMTTEAHSLEPDERQVLETLLKRGASVLVSLPGLEGRPVHDVLFSLMEKGLARADSFTPIRQWLNKTKIEKAAVKQRARSKVLTQTAGRWEASRPVQLLSLEQQMERAFSQAVILCRETASLFNIDWTLALEKLRVWEYTGKARRGYFFEGLSGAQFIHEDAYVQMLSAFEFYDTQDQDIIWINASDPTQSWGRLLPHLSAESSFTCVSGTVVAMQAGQPIAAFEKSGAAVRVFDSEIDGAVLLQALQVFVHDYRNKRIFPDKKRLTVKNYPPEAAGALEAAGFKRVMMDWVLYQIFS